MKEFKRIYSFFGTIEQESTKAAVYRLVQQRDQELGIELKRQGELASQLPVKSIIQLFCCVVCMFE